MENIPRVNLLCHVIQTFVIPVGQDHLGPALELIQIIDNPAAEKGSPILQRGLIDDHRRALGLDPLHHPLDAALAEIIRMAFHGQPVHPNHTFLFLPGLILPVLVIIIIPGHSQHPVGNEVLPRPVALHNGPDEIFRHIRVIGQKLLRVLGKAVAPYPKDGLL